MNLNRIHSRPSLPSWCQFSHQLYTSLQLMGFPALMERESVRMGRVTIYSLLMSSVPRLITTGSGMFGFGLPIRLIDGTCLNFFVFISRIKCLPQSYSIFLNWQNYSVVFCIRQRDRSGNVACFCRNAALNRNYSLSSRNYLMSNWN